MFPKIRNNRQAPDLPTSVLQTKPLGNAYEPVPSPWNGASGPVLLGGTKCCISQGQEKYIRPGESDSVRAPVANARTERILLESELRLTRV